MTVRQATFLKSNILTFANIIVLLGVLIQQVQWQERTDNRLNVLEKSVLKHHSDTDAHMPFEKKIEVFVPRIEIDQRLKSMENTLLRIEKKINK